jgi:hypothetical protein
MNDPERILDGSVTNEVDSLSHDLLSSLSPTREEKDKVLGKVLSQAGLAAAAGAAVTTFSAEAGASGASGAAKAALAVQSSLGKWLLPLLVVVPVGAGVGYVSWSASSQAPSSREVTFPGEKTSALMKAPFHSDAPASPLPVEQGPLEPSDDAVPALPAEPESARIPPPALPSKESALREENRLVRVAREQWKAGQRDAALTTLAELSRRFPHGVLLQERAMLRASILKNPHPAPSTAHPAESQE